MKYRAFISYRRQDASAAARWLREKLLGFRPPKELLDRVTPERRVDLERRVAYFLDTSYQSANEDFWTGNIEPALRESEYLIVISSPAALQARPDGSENWVAREIDTFLKIWGEVEGRRRIIVALAPGAPEDRFPGRLNALGDQWDWADLRDVSRFAPLRAGAAERLGDALLKIVARIHAVPQELLPILRQEEARKRGRLRVAIGAAAAVAFIVLSTALGWAIVERNRTEAARQETLRQRDEARRTQAQLIAQLATITLERGDFGAALALALEALPRHRDDGQRIYVAEAERALREVVMAPLRETRVHRDAGSNVITLADGGIAVFADDESRLSVIDVVQGRTLVALRATSGKATDAVLSDDRRLLLIGWDDGTAHLWDIAANREITDFPSHRPGLLRVALSHDRMLVTTASQDGSVRLWRVDRRDDEPRRLPSCAILQYDTPNVPTLVFAPDNRHVAIGCASGIRVWSIEREREVVLTAPPIPPEWDWPPDLAFADGRLIAAGSDAPHGEKFFHTGPIIWDVETGSLQRVLPNGIYAERLQISRDGRHVLATGLDNTALLWTAGGNEPIVLRHGAIIRSAKFLSDGARVITASEDGVARLWNTGGRQLAMWQGFVGERPDFIALSKDETSVVIAQRKGAVIQIWDLANRDVLALSPPSPARNSVTALAMSADGTRTAATYKDGRTYVWRTADGGLITSFVSGADPEQLPYTWSTGLSFAPDDASRLLLFFVPENDAELRNADTGQLITRLGDAQNRTRSARAVFAGNGKLIATREPNGVLIWDGLSGAHLKRLTVPSSVAPNGIFSLSMSRDGQRLLALGGGARTGEAYGQIWSGANWADIVPLQRSDMFPIAVLSPDGSSILATSGREVYLLDPRGEIRRTIGPHDKSTATQFAPDGRTMLSASGWTVRVWSSAGLLAEFPADELRHNMHRFSPDSTRLLVLSADGRLRLWDIASRSLLAVLPLEGKVTRAEFSGESIAAASDDGRVYVWRYPPSTAALLDYACSRMTRPLSRQQRKQFGLEEDPKDPPCGWHPDMKEKPPYVPKAAGR